MTTKMFTDLDILELEAFLKESDQSTGEDADTSASGVCVSAAENPAAHRPLPHPARMPVKMFYPRQKMKIPVKMLFPRQRMRRTPTRSR